MVPQESSRKISEQAGRVTQKRESPEWHARHLSRRSFIRQAGLTAAAMALLRCRKCSAAGAGSWPNP